MREFWICLEAGYFRVRQNVVKRIMVIKFGVDSGDGSDRGCFGIRVRTDTAS